MESLVDDLQQVGAREAGQRHKLESRDDDGGMGVASVESSPFFKCIVVTVSYPVDTCSSSKLRSCSVAPPEPEPSFIFIR